MVLLHTKEASIKIETGLTDLESEQWCFPRHPCQAHRHTMHAMQPKHLLETFSTEQIRGWFDEADRDGSGTLCINEFFMWSLQDASAQFGSKALQSAFERYDRDNTGQLDAMEFGKACAEPMNDEDLRPYGFVRGTEDLLLK